MLLLDSYCLLMPPALSFMLMTVSFRNKDREDDLRLEVPTIQFDDSDQLD
jgi:hypothetical protein